jgi:outer membrane protein assembly factor BamA
VSVRLAVVLALAVQGTWLVAGTVAATERSYIPLPAFDTDPNSGQTYGVLPVVLSRDDQGQVRSIIAPSLTYNEIRGVTGTFRYFGYPSPGERIDVIAGYSQTIERTLDLEYRNLGLFGNRFHADVRLLHDRDAAVRFFGLGPESKLEDETNMTLGETGFYAIVGVNVSPSARLSLGETIQRFDVRRGGIPDLPFTGDVFPDLPGVDGATVHAQRVILAYDTRDSQSTPTRGVSLSLFVEASSELLGSASDYVKSGLDVVYLRPLWDGRLVLVVRGLIEALSGDTDTPFEVFPTLGGGDTLRGFSEDRFYGNARVLLNLEARVRLFQLKLFGVTAEFQAAPFVDIGTVFNSIGEFGKEGFEVTPGIGLRGIVAPSVVGHVEFGLSREGAAIFVGLDYPF